MKVVFLMAGDRVRCGDDIYPLYLSEVNGKLILEHIIATIPIKDISDCIFCVRSDDVSSFHVDSIVRQLVPNANVISVNSDTKGAACTALLAGEFIDCDEEILILASTDFVDADVKMILDYFRDNDSDVGVVSFPSVHPRYSFVKFGEDGYVAEVSEKRPISRNALASFYYFKEGKDFVEGAKSVIRKDYPINGSFYLSQVVNEMILMQKKVALFHIEQKNFHPLKTEYYLKQYIAEIKNLDTK